MSQKPKPQTSIGMAVKRAIRHLDESKGSSFVDIKKYLLSMYQASGNMPDSESIKEYLKNAIDKGALLKLDNGNYKIKETARRRKSRSRSSSRGKSRRRSRSRKRSGGKRRSRSGSRRRKRSSSGKGRRKHSSSGRRRKRSSSGKRRRSRRAKAPAEDVAE